MKCNAKRTSVRVTLIVWSRRKLPVKKRNLKCKRWSVSKCSSSLSFRPPKLCRKTLIKPLKELLRLLRRQKLSQKTKTSEEK